MPITSFIKAALSTTQAGKITALSLLCLLTPINAVNVQATAKEPTQASSKMIEHPSQKIARLLATVRGSCDAWASEPDSQLTAPVLSTLEEALDEIVYAQVPSSLGGAPETPMSEQGAEDFYAEATPIVASFLQTELSSPSETLEFRQQLLEILENQEIERLGGMKAIAYYRIATAYVELGDIEAALDYIRQSESVALTDSFRYVHEYSYPCQFSE